MNTAHDYNDLGSRAFQGGLWVISTRFGLRIIDFIRLIILARILSPSDFGIMGIALLSLTILDTFSRTGFNAALIQKQKDPETFLNTAWTISIIRGTVISLLLFIGAPLIGIFFNSHASVNIIRIVGLCSFIGSFNNIGIVYFDKELDFRKKSILNISATVISFFVTVISAVILRNVFTLVIGTLVSTITTIIMSYILSSFRPRLELKCDKASDLWSFGKWILGSNILVFLLNQGDDILVGRILGAKMLGFYQMAYKISNLPATMITSTISQVSFSAYSKLQYSTDKLRYAYLSVLEIITFISFPLAGIIIILAPDLVSVILGDQWLTIILPLQILTFWGLIRSIGASTGAVFQAIGRPKIITILTSIKLLILIILIIPFTIKWGITGTSIAVVITSLFSNPMAIYATIRILKCGLWDFIQNLIYPLIGTIFMAAVYPLKHIVSMNPVIELIILLLIAIILYILAIALISRYTKYTVYSNIRMRIQNLLRDRRSSE